MKLPFSARWPLYFLQWTLGITLLGAIMGAVVFPVVGVIWETGYTPLQLALNGVKILSFFFGIWAPGIGLVLTVKAAYEARQTGGSPATETKSENPADR